MLTPPEPASAARSFNPNRKPWLAVGLTVMWLACSTATADLGHPGLRHHSEFLIISVAGQVLYHYKENKIYKEYPISTSEYGVDNRVNSNKTPLGLHLIKRKYGDGARVGLRFVGRQSTDEISPIYQDGRRSKTEDVLTRIMHLSGLEPGINQGGGVDSYNRYIYIHGTSEEGRIGIPSSHGCIRMKNLDVIELYQNVQLDTRVLIVDQFTATRPRR